METPQMHTAYIALGSNIEPRGKYLQRAIERIEQLGSIARKSTIIETAPVGFTEQPEFLNAVLELHTSLSAQELLAKLREIEKSLGRKVRPKWHEREIDLDILFYDDLILSTAEHTIPHPDLHRRGFVLIPLAEIAPTFVHPVLRLSVHELLSQFISRIDGQ